MGLFGSSEEEKPDEPPFSDQWHAVPDDDAQQYEYHVLDLREAYDSEAQKKKHDWGTGELPPDDVLNRLGKEGWELVGTIEQVGKQVGAAGNRDGSKTDGLVFKRPVSYERVEDDGG